MALRTRSFAHWSPWLAGAAVGVALAAGTAGLAAAGASQIVAGLLAGVGAATVILAAVGHLQFRPRESRIEDRLREIFSALPVPIAVTDRKGIVLWRSEAFATAVGGLGLEQDLSRLGERQPETAAAIFRLFGAARGGCTHAETIALTNSMNSAAFALKVAPFGEQGKRCHALIWQIEDTKTSAAGPSAGGNMLEALPVPALLIGKELSVESANPSFEKLLGNSPAGMQAWTLFRTKRGRPFTRAWLRDLMAQAGGPVPVQIAGSGGVFRPATLYIEQDSGGSYLCLAVPAGAAEGLDGSFNAVLAHAPVPMALLNAKGIIQTANEAFCHLFGGQHGNLSGKPLTSLVAGAAAQNVKDKLAALQASGSVNPSAAEVHAGLRDTADKRVRFTIFRAAAENCLIVTAAETQGAVLIDEQAAQSQKLQAVGELAGGIAHDFNNLLTAIIGYSDLLLRRFRASDPAFKDLMKIKNSATRAAELVKQILAYSRKQTLRPAILNLTDVIEEFQATMGRTLGEKIKARVLHGRDLWFVKADEGQIFQVVMNLAVNARDAMPDGGEITIRTANVSERESLALKDRGVDRGEYVLCEVRDTGTGIKPEHLKKIFDPFFSTKEVGKGTGLGLSTVFGIVKQTGGTIVVDSEIGAGTTFRIYLPRYVETEEDLKTLASKAEAPDKIADLTGSGTVLLVEDEEAVRSFASRALSTRGYTVLEASTGVEALDIMDREEGKVDLVVSDVVMPEMDGPTLLRHLRERNPDIRIVFMSGYAEEAFRKNLGADENFIFLPKPFTLKKLAETVKAAAA